MDRFTVFGRPGCGYCVRARQVLELLKAAPRPGAAPKCTARCNDGMDISA